MPTDFTYQNGSNLETKSDRPGKSLASQGIPHSQGFDAADSNLVQSALGSLRTGIVAGLWRKLVHNASAPVSGSGEVVTRSLNGVLQSSENGGPFRRVRPIGTFDISDYSGSNPLGTGDSTSALAAAIADASAGQLTGDYFAAGQVFIPPGVWRITSLLQVIARPGFRIFGAGRRNSILYWDGTEGQDVIQFLNMQHWMLDGFSIELNPAKLAGAVINSIHDNTPGGYAPTANVIQHVSINSINGGGRFTKGIVTGGVNQANNSEMLLFNVQMQGTSDTEACVSFECPQNRAQVMYGCRFYGGKRGVSTSLGTGNQGGDFVFRDGNVGGTLKADFDLGAVNSRIVIDNVTSEGSKRFLRTFDVDALVPSSYPANAGAFPVNIKNCLFSADSLAGDLAAVAYHYSGPFTIEGGSFGVGAQACPQIMLVSAGYQRASIKGVHFGSNGSVTADFLNLTTASTGVQNQPDIEGNTFVDGSGNLRSRADSVGVAPNTHFDIYRVAPIKRKKVPFHISYDQFIAAGTSQVYQLPGLAPHTQIRRAFAYVNNVWAGVSGLTFRLGLTSGGAELLRDFLASPAGLPQFTVGLLNEELGSAIAAQVQGGAVDLPGGVAAPAVYLKLTGATNLGNGSTTNLTGGQITIILDVEVWEGFNS